MDLNHLNQSSHRRKNILTGQWILVSPQRTQRPWQGEVFTDCHPQRLAYDPDCYLCPRNQRANGERNPEYTGTFAFTNDFPALRPDNSKTSIFRHGLLLAVGEPGICRVLNFSPRHDVTLAEMDIAAIERVIVAWQQECRALSQYPEIRSIQIFENKGGMMGNSNPHPHCQIWAQRHLPTEVQKEAQHFRAYFHQTGHTLLEDYLKTELELQQRIVWENNYFVVLVPFWAVWPFETMIIPRRKAARLTDLSPAEINGFAQAMQAVTCKYDHLFHTSFPYSSGIHQAPYDQREHPHWHWHMHFLPPLLRSATVRKYMVGYEMLAEPQRDITPESSAAILRRQPTVHFKQQQASKTE